MIAYGRSSRASYAAHSPSPPALRLCSASPLLSLLSLSLLLCLTLLPSGVLSSGQSYSAGAPVPILVNNVGPFHNPAESYKYYSLPYCEPSADSAPTPAPASDNLGEILAGDRRRASLYDVRFRSDDAGKTLCEKALSAAEVESLVRAIRQHYVFEMFVDELAVKGFVGEMEEVGSGLRGGGRHRFNAEDNDDTDVFLFTHLDFSIAYNEDRVVAVNLTTDPARRLQLAPGQPATVKFSYSAHWQPSSVPYGERDSYHSLASFHEQSIEIHWLSIINSFVLVLLLTAFLAVILMRVLNKDFARYMEMDEEEGADDDEEVGWKLVHGDVFRFPSASMLLAAIVGNGAQILVLVVAILLLALFGTFYPGNRGALYSAAVVLYAATAFIAGFVSTRLYLQLGGTRWASSSILTACLFSVPFFLTFSVVNSVAWAYGSSSALPAATIVLIMLLYALVSFPLTIFGSMRARKGVQPFDSPCKTNRVEREIPPSPLYRSALLHYLIAGFLPFSAIYIELHYIFVAIYGPRVYTLYGILSLAFVMLVIVTAFITVALTYFQLAAEDYRWWWRSVKGGAAVGAFMYCYAAFYYVYRSEMTGVVQAVFFFGYLLMVSFAFSLLCSAVAFTAAQAFVKHIYRSIKID